MCILKLILQVSVSYHKTSQQAEERNNTAHSAAANAAMAAAQWSHQGQKPHDEQTISMQGPYSEEDIERLAEYSASTYAKNETEKATYLEYYRSYYRNGGTLDGSSNSTSTDITGAEQSKNISEVADNGKDLGTVTVDGTEYKKYGMTIFYYRITDILLIFGTFHPLSIVHII